jgi:hypothetical protein
MGKRKRCPTARLLQPSVEGWAGNQQALDLATSAAARGFELLCFDQGHGQTTKTWAGRDQWMATNLLEQWRRLCVDERVVAICGSLHARLSPDQGIGRWLRKADSARAIDPRPARCKNVRRETS